MAITPPATLARPFAESGDKASIPDTTATAGAASLTEGFPPVTQLPLSAGGIPPRRLDFNGILNQLSQFAFWAQSGGQFRWNSALDYASPCMVFGSDGKIYFGVAPSGPGVSGVGAKNPVTAANQGTYWVGLTGYALEPATKTKLGGIIVGDGFTITAAGLLSVDPNSFSSDLIVELMKQLRMPQWLTSNKNWYVRSDGDDNNDGSANDAAHAFKTIQKALTYVAENFNISTFNAVIEVAAGIYTETVTLPKYSASTGRLNIRGESKETTLLNGPVYSVPAAGRFNWYNFTFKSVGNSTSPGSSQYFEINLLDGLEIQFVNCKLNLTVSPGEGRVTYGIAANGASIRFSSATQGEPALIVDATGVANISYLFGASAGGSFTISGDIVINSSAAIYTIRLQGLSQWSSITPVGWTKPAITGSATGQRYRVEQNSICNTGGGGANYFPGSTDGTVSSGGQYL